MVRKAEEMRVRKSVAVTPRDMPRSKKLFNIPRSPYVHNDEALTLASTLSLQRVDDEKRPEARLYCAKDSVRLQTDSYM